MGYNLKEVYDRVKPIYVYEGAMYVRGVLRHENLNEKIMAAAG